MELWIAVCENFFDDPVATVHRDRQVAIDHARAFMRENVEKPEAVDEEELHGRWWSFYDLDTRIAARVTSAELAP
jgi:hypothetical protein